MVPLHPALLKVGVFPKLATFSPMRAALSIIHLPLWFAMCQPHSIGHPLVSPAMRRLLVSMKVSPIALSFVINSSMQQLGVRWQLTSVTLFIFILTNPSPDPCSFIRDFSLGTQIAAVFDESAIHNPSFLLRYCSLINNTSAFFSNFFSIAA